MKRTLRGFRDWILEKIALKERILLLLIFGITLKKVSVVKSKLLNSMATHRYFQRAGEMIFRQPKKIAMTVQSSEIRVTNLLKIWKRHHLLLS
ncbi:hypothetical protein D3C87_1710350 [compost metagenome]